VGWFTPGLVKALHRLGFELRADGRNLCRKATLSVVQLEDGELCRLAIAWFDRGSSYHLELTIPTGDLLKAAKI
jgi:hypothetical protein